MEQLKLVEHRYKGEVLGYRLLVNEKDVMLLTTELFSFSQVRRHTLEQVGVVLHRRNRADWEDELAVLVEDRKIIQEAAGWGSS